MTSPWLWLLTGCLPDLGRFVPPMDSAPDADSAAHTDVVTVGDTHADTGSGCDSSDTAITRAPETCGDGLDSNCDGAATPCTAPLPDDDGRSWFGEQAGDLLGSRARHLGPPDAGAPHIIGLAAWSEPQSTVHLVRVGDPGGLASAGRIHGPVFGQAGAHLGSGLAGRLDGDGRLAAVAIGAHHHSPPGAEMGGAVYLISRPDQIVEMDLGTYGPTGFEPVLNGSVPDPVALVDVVDGPAGATLGGALVFAPARACCAPVAG